MIDIRDPAWECTIAEDGSLSSASRKAPSSPEIATA